MGPDLSGGLAGHSPMFSRHNGNLFWDRDIIIAQGETEATEAGGCLKMFCKVWKRDIKKTAIANSFSSLSKARWFESFIWSAIHSK